MTKIGKAFATVNGAKPWPTVPRILTCALFAILCALAFGVLTAASAVKMAVLVALPEGQKRSGKSGTLVWLRNDIMRTWALPRVVRNAYTTAVRATLSGLSTAWRGLTQAQQSGWINGGRGIVNRLGKHVEINGKTCYVQLNANLTTIGVATYNDYQAPGAVVVPKYAAPITLDIGTTKLTINVSNSSLDSGIVIEATAPLSAGINSPKNSAFRVIRAQNTSAAYQASLTRDADNYTAYVAKFGAPVAGDCVFVRAKYINNVTGDSSVTSQEFKVIVT